MDNPICSVYESFEIYCCGEQAGGAEEERGQIPSLQFFKLLSALPASLSTLSQTFSSFFF